MLTTPVEHILTGSPFYRRKPYILLDGGMSLRTSAKRVSSLPVSTTNGAVAATKYLTYSHF